MASELIELAREVGGEELARRVERLQDELEEVEQEIEAEQDLEQQLIEQAELSESAVEGMDLQAKREVAKEFGLGEESVNVSIPVAGRANQKPAYDGSGEIPIRRSSPDTYEREVPLEGGEDPKTMTVEYANRGPSLDAVAAFNEALFQRFVDQNQRAKERAQQRQEEQANQGIRSQYLNLEEIDTADLDDSDVPVAGQGSREE